MAIAAAAQKNQAANPSSYGKLNVFDALVSFARARQALRANDHATSGSVGEVGPWAEAKGEIPMGFAEAKGESEGVTGNATTPESVPLDLSSQIVLDLTVAGATSAAVATGRPVYASDDATYTLTRPAAPTLPLGFVLDFRSSGVANVYFFSVGELAVLAMAAHRRTVFLGTFDWSLGDGDAVTDRIWSDGHGLISSLFGVVTVDTVGSGGTIAYNVEIGAVNLTGGVVTIVEANSRGSVVAGTAVTAANEIHDGDTFSVEATGAAGTRTTGRFDLYATVDGELGL